MSRDDSLNVFLSLLILLLTITGCGGARTANTPAAKARPPVESRDIVATQSLTLPDFIPDPLASFTYRPLPPLETLLSTTEKAKVQAHDRATYYLDLADFYLKHKDDPKRAIECLLKTVHLEPTCTRANLKLAEIFLLKQYYLVAYHYLIQADLENSGHPDIELTRQAIKLEHQLTRERLVKLRRRARSGTEDPALQKEISELEERFFNRNEVFTLLNLRLPVEILEATTLDQLASETYYLPPQKEEAEPDKEGKDNKEKKGEDVTPPSVSSESDSASD